MIISYLARIVLLLPDLSASDNDRLTNIAQSSNARFGRLNHDAVDARTNSTTAQQAAAAQEPTALHNSAFSSDLFNNGTLLTSLRNSGEKRLGGGVWSPHKTALYDVLCCTKLKIHTAQR